MEIIRLLILNHDKEYGFALGKAISNLHRNFQVTIGLNEKNNANISKEFDFVLIEGYSKGEIIKMLNLNILNKQMIELVDEKIENMELLQKSNLDVHNLKIYKYSKVSEIISDVYFIYSVSTGKKNLYVKSFNTSIIGFYSASGGAGKPVISIGTARELSRYHDKRVLLLNFEEISSFGLYLKEDLSKRTISEYLYYLFQKNDEKLCSFIEGYLYKDEYCVELFHQSQGSNELKRLNKDELAYFFKVIQNCNRYEYILLDLASDLTDETLYLLNYCNKIVYVEDESHISNYKSDQLIECMNKLISTDFFKSFIKVKNKFICSRDIDSASENKSHSTNFIGSRNIEIEKDENSFNYVNGHLEISINHVFGLGIKKIVDEILVN